MKKLLIFLLWVLMTTIHADYIPFDQAIDLLQKAQSQDYPNSHEVYLVNKIEYLNNDCLGYSIDETYKKILTEEGKRNNEVFFYKDLIYDSLIVEEIKLIKSDGKVVTFDPDKFLTVTDPPGWSNIYSNQSKYLTGNIPDLEIGDILYEKTKNIAKKRVMENNFFTTYSLETFSSYLNDYLEISIPSEKQLYIYELNKNEKEYDFEYKKEERDGRTKHTWNNKNSTQLIYEPYMEDTNFILHQYGITTAKNWEEISKWYFNIVKPHMNTTEAMQKKVDEIIKGVEGRKEKAAKLFYWVARKIRYLGVDKETNRPGFEPHDVAYTFETKGGVCRDKAALLTAMLRLAGIGSDVILISSGSRLNHEFPIVWFNHAITVSYDDKGEPEFIFDPTDENTKDFLPKYEEDNSYLIASEKGETLRTTPVSLPENNNSTANIDLVVKGDIAEGNIKYDMTGLGDTIFRSILDHYTGHELENYFSKLLGKINPSIELLELTYTDPKNKEKNMKVELKVKINNFIDMSREHIFIPFDVSKLNIHFLFRSIMGPFSLQSRNFDFKMGGTYSLDTYISLKLDKEIENISFPKVDELDFHGFKTKIENKFENNVLTAHYHFESSKIHFKKEDYLAVKNKLSSLDKYGNLYMIGKIGGVK
ncbi:MAG: DUF3857 and transglutaminase domain-containing protein [Candidatus Delongbacteria bacterium]|nr:DUF3857 and transglutaminase domain-containing protein [Candidatus Delongbacteria bacterium]